VIALADMLHQRISPDLPGGPGAPGAPVSGTGDLAATDLAATELVATGSTR
jgi:hypothetical protein